MINRLLAWTEDLFDRLFGVPIEVPPEEMARARREMEERVAMDRKEAINPLPPPPCTLQRLHSSLQQRDDYDRLEAVEEVACALKRYIVATGDGSAEGVAGILSTAGKKTLPEKYVRVFISNDGPPELSRGPYA